MAQITQDMNLVLWNDLDDPYDHTQLASNFEKIANHDHSGGLGGKKLNGGQSIIPNTITSLELAPDSVGAEELADYSSDSNNALRPVTTNSIQNYSITKNKLAFDSVSNVNIINNEITIDKLNANSFRVPLYVHSGNGSLPLTRKDGGQLYPGYLIDYSNVSDTTAREEGKRKYLWRLRYLYTSSNGKSNWEYVGGLGYNELRRTSDTIWSSGSGPEVGAFYTGWGNQKFQSFELPLAGTYKVTTFVNAQIESGNTGVFQTAIRIDDSSPPTKLSSDQRQDYTTAYSYFVGDGSNGTVGDQTSAGHTNLLFDATNSNKRHLWQVHGASRKSGANANVGILFQRMYVEPYAEIRNWG